MGCIDRSLVIYDRLFGSSINDRSWKRIEQDNNSDKYMIFFLGWKASIGVCSHMFKQFPEKNHIIYKLPNSMLSGNLKTMKESWDEVIYHVKNDIKRYDIDSVYGLSLGNTLALYVAERCNPVEIYLDLPYHMLAYVIWHGPLTSPVKDELKKNGTTYFELRDFLKPYEPVNNISKKNYHVFTANWDTIVPRASVDVLLKSMKPYAPSVYNAPFVGHYLGALSSFYIKRWLRR